jgi:hypothetical protein
VSKDGHLEFSSDYLFNSASAAANVVSGTTQGGGVAWRLSDETTYRDWELKQIPAAEDAARQAD